MNIQRCSVNSIHRCHKAPTAFRSCVPPSHRLTIAFSKSQDDASLDINNHRSYYLALVASGLLSLSLLSMPMDATARPEGVNRPDLLPKEFTTVIDVAGFLTPSEENRIKAEVESLERDTGYKLRVLAQNYPETPGLAVRDYWNVDDRSIVFVADPTFQNILNFNVGGTVDLDVPQSFWSRLSGKYGNKFYWQEKGEAKSILDAVSAVDSCLREEPGRFKCSKVQGELGEEPSSGGFGKFFGQ
ncbi:hypothetical protein CEUSTIGMA_g8562.t1 [Chlamydomonas eustigma]|uniref:TPM domain-containing protein n=1 Tax=Chlamydomonas eustigma TaxID=1157962 RepID=A0A250XDH6_9CHLO|nr:hypothetical protein CEUSTIGMA_g8562.t1 [Chlamydomonas eustigma]|eukprot:GAX81128.1 hypothetical protein CEUSTIGMA_g8562.t1 [Chlamydomonas eustigma]